jgi:hypothetical protein
MDCRKGNPPEHVMAVLMSDNYGDCTCSDYHCIFKLESWEKAEKEYVKVPATLLPDCCSCRWNEIYYKLYNEPQEIW